MSDESSFKEDLLELHPILEDLCKDSAGDEFIDPVIIYYVMNMEQKLKNILLGESCIYLNIDPKFFDGRKNEQYSYFPLLMQNIAKKSEKSFRIKSGRYILEISADSDPKDVSLKEEYSLMERMFRQDKYQIYDFLFHETEERTPYAAGKLFVDMISKRTYGNIEYKIVNFIKNIAS